MSPTQAFTGITAALLRDVPLPWATADAPRLDVTSLRPQRAMRRPGIRGCERGDGEVVVVDGLPLLEAGLAWVDLGRDLSVPDLIAAGDRLVSGTLRTGPIAGIADLAAAISRRPGSPGVRCARAALPHVRVGAWSRPETFLRLLLVAAELPEPALNVAVLAERDSPLADLAWPAYRVVVEYDGQQHAATWDADAARHERLVDAGWTVVRVRKRELFHEPGAVVARMLRRLSERGYRHPRTIDLTRLPRFRA